MPIIKHFILPHRIWLRSRGLTDRPWLILGSAPSPAIPSRLPDRCAHIHVKYAGHSAKELGLPAGDLTMLLEKSPPDRIEGLEFKSILRMRRKGSATTAIKRGTPVISYSEYEIRNRERDALVKQIAGSLFGELGDEQRPSNGIAMICYAVAVGVPQVIIAGISLSTEGHAYNDDQQKRRHKIQDRAALEALARRFPDVVSTSEPELADLTGLSLYRSNAQ